MRHSVFLILICTIICVSCNSVHTSQDDESRNNNTENTIQIPTLLINGDATHNVSKAYRIALGDISGNIQYHKSNLSEDKKACLYAGLIYGKPWTRDAAINVWNGFGLLSKEVSKNTLNAQVGIDSLGKKIIIGQYWDKIIWTIGAWNYYLYTGDYEYLEFAYNVSKNTILQLEQNEFSEEIGLFRGPAVYGDGVAAYPKIYTRHQDKSKSASYSGIEQWAEFNQDIKHPVGEGIPMHALSTNTVYYKAYTLLQKMETELSISFNNNWKQKEKNLKTAINKHFWNNNTNYYNYLVDPFGGSEAQESIGISFALLFDIVDKDYIDTIFNKTVIEPAGIPCVYPSFERYRNESLDSYGRHSGTVWPHIQGFWAHAATTNNRYDLFMHEFNNLTNNALRDFQFVEIYHPTKKTKYGGIQEPYHLDWTEWFCAERQTWSATAYFRMVLMDIIGLNFDEDGILFKPYLPEGINQVNLIGLKYRDAILDIEISGTGNNIKSFMINNAELEDFRLPENSKGQLSIKLVLGN